MKNKKKFGWGFIGCGAITKKTAKELWRSENCFVAAFLSRNLRKAERFAKKYGGNAYDNFASFIADPSLDGVYIALPHDMHAEMTKRCIEAHKPVLCEKPFTVNAKQAEAVFTDAEEKGVYVAEAMWTWHNEAANKVREWLSQKRIGEIQDVTITFGFPMLQFRPNKRLTDPARAGGVLLDLGIYGIRYAVELFGVPNKVYAKGRIKGGVDYGEEVELHYEGFNVHLSFAMDRLVGEKAFFQGSEGTIEVPFFHFAKKAFLKGRYPETFRTKGLLYEREFSNTAKEIQDGLITSQIIDKKNVLATLRVMDEIRTQLGVVYPFED